MSLQLKYPSFDVKIKNVASTSLSNQPTQPKIFDPIRKKWFVLTPEEWVRQHVLNYLIVIKKYPASLISVEKEVTLNDLKKRYDVVVYKKDLSPLLVIECKAPYIELNKSTIEQAQRYNLILKANYVMITNGIADFVFDLQNNSIDLPDYI